MTDSMNKMHLIRYVLLVAALAGQGRSLAQPIAADSAAVQRAESFAAAGQVDSATLVLDHALVAIRQEPMVDTLRALFVTQRKGWMLYEARYFPQAYASFQEALSLSRGYYGHKSWETGECLSNMGNALLGKADYPEADSLYHQSLDILKAAAGEDALVTGWAWHNCGITAMYAGRFSESLDDFERALGIKRAHYGEDNEDVARTLTYLGFLYNLFGDYEKGDACTESAARISLRQYSPDHLGYYYAKNNLVELHIHRGDFDLAKTAAREAIAGKVRLLDTAFYYDLAGSWNWLGLAFQAADQFDSAQWAFREALHYHQLSGYQQELEQAHVLHNLGTNVLYLGQPDSSLHYLDEALLKKAPITGPGSEEYVSTLVMRGSAQLAIGQPGAALHDLESAMEFLESTGMVNGLTYRYCLVKSLETYASLGMWTEARGSAFKLAAANKHKMIALTNFGSERELLMASEEAYGTLMRLYDLYARWPEDQDTGLVRLLADETLFFNGYVLNEMAGIRQRMYRDTAHRDLFESLNRAKAQWLAVQLYMGEAAPSMPMLRSRVDSLEKALVRSSLVYAGFRQPWTSSDAIRALRPGEAMLVFTEMECPAATAPGRQLAAFLFCHDDPQPRYIELGKVAVTDNQQAGDLRVEDLVASGFLTDSLWGKIAPHVAGIGRLFYVPAGILHRVNLAALPQADGSLLMEHHSFVRLLNARRMPAHELQEDRPADAFVVGGVDYDAPAAETPAALPASQVALMRDAPWTERGTALQEWPPLPGTAQEAKVVARLLEANQCVPTVLAGRAATEESLHMLGRSGTNSKSPDILHLATHGYFFPLSDDESLRPAALPSVIRNVKDPMVRSGIIVAGANAAWTGTRVLPTAGDGIVTASEISRLDLSDTRIVVLSACDTGLGDIASGEGIMGLQRAFRIAGADKILMSLRKVPDAATAHLMGQFYQHWIEGGLSPGQALEQAQRDMRDAGFPLSHWAGFVLAE